jgi:hypothetical protein
LLIIIAAIWFAGWGWGGYGGWWWGRPRTIVVQQGNVQPTGEGVAVLNAADKQPFVGQAFSIRNVRVAKKVNDQAFWIGTGDHARSMLVVGSTAGNIREGEQIDVTGTVEKAPPAAQAKQQWSLSDDGAQRLEQQRAYVQANQVQQARR